MHQSNKRNLGGPRVSCAFSAAPESTNDKCLYTYNTTMRANYMCVCAPVRCVLAFIIDINIAFF